MAASYESPSEYIQHHLTFLTKPVGDGGFWMINVDTVVTSLILGFIGLGFLWLVTRRATSGVPSKTQAFVELAVGFVNDQVKSIYHGQSLWVAPIALTVFIWVVLMNAMDFLPVDIMAMIYGWFGIHNWRSVPTADVNTTFALALSVFALMIIYGIKSKGIGGWTKELFVAPFGNHPLLWPFNFLFQIVEFVSKPLSHSLRLYGNIYAGEIIFLLLGMWAASGLVGTAFSGVLNLGWAIFHILIVLLQAYIFMMLTIVYLAMGEEHH
ncbi:MAG: F0F1 ATP synthase subunit A [Betaproteobacteria bacterium]|nr:F0F1 ATP synthase subunit A [Betaproteobacteria bacterium]MCC7215421.1 F0F1 ATP synthase subunit A [Burkholderiales bacterium]